MRPKRNTVVFTNTLLLGGAEKQSVLLANGLSESYRVILLVYYGEKVDNRLLNAVSSNVEIIRLAGPHISKIRHYLSVIKNNNIKCIFSSLATSNVLSGITKILYPEIKVFGSIRSCDRPYIKSKVELFLHKYIHDHTVFNNYTGYEHFIRSGYNTTKSTFIPNCIDNTPKFNKRTNGRLVKIISLSRFIPDKDIYTSLKAIKLLQFNFNNLYFNFTLAGYGPEEFAIREYISKHKLADVVNIDINPDVSNIYKESDIYLLTSKREGTSNTILEAMAHGLPIVATDAGDNARLVRHNENGYIAPVGDHEEIAGYLYDLITDHEKRIQFGKEGHKRVSAEYSMDKFIERYKKLIEQY